MRIRKILAIAALAVLTGANPVDTAAQGFDTRLSISQIQVVGTKNPPSFLRVGWSLTGLKSGTRIEGYELTVELQGNGQTGRVVQTPSPNISSVSVGLLGIPNDARAKIFGGPGRVSADVTLVARIVQQSGTRSSISVRRQTSFNPVSDQAAPKPKPDLERIKDGLKKREGVVVRPTPKVKRIQ